MRLGDMLRIERKKKGLTLVELAKITGISRPYLSQLEGGTKQNPSDRNIRILAEALGIDLQALELAVESESSERLSTLREQIRTTEKELEEFQECMATVEGYVNKLKNIELSSLNENSLDSPRQEDLLGKVSELLKKIQLSLDRLRDKQESLDVTMNLLEKTLDVPTWPEPIGTIIREAETLGDEGLQFLEQQINAIKRLLNAKNDK